MTTGALALIAFGLLTAGFVYAEMGFGERNEA